MSHDGVMPLETVVRHRSERGLTEPTEALLVRNRTTDRTLDTPDTGRRKALRRWTQTPPVKETPDGLRSQRREPSRLRHDGQADDRRHQWCASLEPHTLMTKTYAKAPRKRIRRKALKMARNASQRLNVLTDRDCLTTSQRSMTEIEKAEAQRKREAGRKP